MLEAKCQAPLAKATAELMDAWALAASQPAIQTLNFWTRVFRSSLVFPGLALRPQGALGDTATGENRGADILASVPPTPEGSEHPAALAAPGYSSYRSSSGHAVAQVIVPAMN